MLFSSMLDLPYPQPWVQIPNIFVIKFGDCGGQSSQFPPILRVRIFGGISSQVMPRSRGRRRPRIPADQTRAPPMPPAAPGMVQVSLGYDPAGPMEQRDVVSSKDGWSEYELDDGSVIRAKAVIVDVKRAVGQFNAVNGDPTYVLQLSVVSNLKSPDHLKKQNQKTK